MRPTFLLILATLLLVVQVSVSAATLNLSSPLEWQVVQRSSKTSGTILIKGEIGKSTTPWDQIEARIAGGGSESGWQRLNPEMQGRDFNATMQAPAGGWYRVELRVLADREVFVKSAIDHVGVGEVFVIAGQSNSANHGEVKQQSRTGLVTVFDGKHWQLAKDPQPGASGRGGSMMPPFGDALAERLQVPIGIIACGVGASSVREWLPEGSLFPNPPTIEKRVRRTAEGEWESLGTIFPQFVDRLKYMGPQGFRAILWHQGESDANQKDPTRTLPGTLFQKYLEQLIRDTRKEIGWTAPWFVAQASYHSPDDTGSSDIRSAQKALWASGIALEGPDTDQLTGRFRDKDGMGVHMSDAGLQKHAQLWVEKVAPWIERQP